MVPPCTFWRYDQLPSSPFFASRQIPHYSFDQNDDVFITNTSKEVL